MPKISTCLGCCRNYEYKPAINARRGLIALKQAKLHGILKNNSRVKRKHSFYGRMTWRYRSDAWDVQWRGFDADQRLNKLPAKGDSLAIIKSVAAGRFPLGYRSGAGRNLL